MGTVPVEDSFYKAASCFSPPEGNLSTTKRNLTDLSDSSCADLPAVARKFCCSSGGDTEAGKKIPEMTDITFRIVGLDFK